jgi:hypothetical protein
MTAAQRRLEDVHYWLKTDHNLDVTVTDPDTGDPVDITGATNVDWCVAVNASSAALLSKALGTGTSIVDGPAGLLRVSLLVANSSSFSTTGALYHEVKITLAGTRTLVGWGTFYATPTVLA